MEVAIEPSRMTLAPLVTRAASGDREAFRVLVEPHLARALGAAAIVVRSHAEAEDAVQDALVSAWRGLGSLRDPDAFPAWFRRHVVRAALRAAEHRGHVAELDLQTPAEQGELERALQHRSLARAFATLEVRDRVLLTLHHYWDLPVGDGQLLEVAGCTPGGGRLKLHGSIS
ncbi:MAG: hypothetical protein H0W07_01065 [Chloroflexi bacterium]|nr:hypothetical protein [Chloroflexota bacterium]